MEYDILNELISDTVDRFFCFYNKSYSVEGVKSIFQPSTPLSSVASKKTTNIQQQQTYQNNSNQQVQQSTSASTSLSKPNTSNLGTSSSLRSSVQSASTSVQLSSPNASIQQSSQQSSTNTSISISGNADNTKKSGFVAQKNNLFDTSQQAMTPELWLQKEGPNKLKEAQIRLNLNLQRVSRSDLEQMSIDQLMQEKKRVKNELKMYDASFQSHFNRFPAKNEKEPLRPLYIYYKKLKQFMTNKNNGVPIEYSNDLNEKDTADNNKPSSQSNSVSATSSQSLNNNNNNKNAPPNQTELLRKIEEIKKVRADLREKLHNYQTEFFKNHNRRIRYHKDIQQVEKEYKEYKDTKQELLRLESLLQR